MRARTRVILQTPSTVACTRLSTQGPANLYDLDEQLTAVHQDLLSSHLHLGDIS